MCWKLFIDGLYRDALSIQCLHDHVGKTSWEPNFGRIELIFVHWISYYESNSSKSMDTASTAKSIKAGGSSSTIFSTFSYIFKATYFSITMRFAAISALVLPILATATPMRRTGDQCSSGDIQCCNSTQTVWLITWYTVLAENLTCYCAQVTALSLPIIGGLLGLALPIITGLAGCAFAFVTQGFEQKTERHILKCSHL